VFNLRENIKILGPRLFQVVIMENRSFKQKGQTKMTLPAEEKNLKTWPAKRERDRARI
jgi:hypothetical protein